MVIHKILNNNLILSKDEQGHEVIVKGCGIAFQKKTRSVRRYRAI